MKNDKYNFKFENSNSIALVIPWIFSPIVCSLNLYFGLCSCLFLGITFFIYTTLTIEFYDEYISVQKYKWRFKRVKTLKYIEILKVNFHVRTMSLRYNSTFVLFLTNKKKETIIIQNSQIKDFVKFLNTKSLMVLINDKKHLK